MTTDGPIQIDLGAVLASKLGKRSRYIPRFLIRAIEKLICRDELNALLRSNHPRRGAAFCEGLLADLDVRLDVRDSDKLPQSPRCIIVSNHPLGGLDGISMIAWLSRHYGGRNVHFVVNDLLMAVEPLTECFVPINKHGAQSRASASGLDTVLRGDDPVVIYPAGMVSRLGDDGTIADLKWRKTVINKAIEHKRDIVPVFFDGYNRMSFYRIARWRERLGLKFNFEQVLLPREFVRCRHAVFTLTCGAPVPWQSLKGGADAAREILQLREKVYSLATNQNEHGRK
ncbi:MAG: 1-acyl-sn-glycerol-3-phosphate acyltransferase [Muribaculaceae bacterium]|nr:1-acyl-sn-glycerol-3-phosphate acyltransferase [Muribaculaceae bacterium]